MKKIIFLITLIFISSGCASVGSITAPNRAHLLKLSIGMSKTDTLKMMGSRTMVVKDDLFHSVIINNPYRSEILRGKDKTFEVFYYATDNKYDDNIIRDDDLTPLVFEDRMLIGWGQNFLKSLIEENEIKNAPAQSDTQKSNDSMGFGKKKKKK